MIIFIFFLLLPPLSFSQGSMHFRHISLNEGLSQSSVQCILQDRDGFIWLGTQNGLNKYDGISITIFQQDPLDPCSISNNIILCLAEDNNGDIWAGTMGGGLQRYDRHCDKFDQPLHNNKFEDIFNETIIWSLHYDTLKECLWIGGNSGLYSFNTGSTVMKSYTAPEALLERINGQAVLCILRDHEGNIWLGTNGTGLFSMNNDQSAFNHYLHQPQNPKSIPNNIIWSIEEDKNGSLWIGTEKGLAILDTTRNNFGDVSFISEKGTRMAEQAIWSLMEDGDRNLWMGTNNGIIMYEPFTGSCFTYEYRRWDPWSLSNNTVWTLFQDMTGVIWAGTNDGANLFSPSRQKFQLYQHDPDDPSSLPEAPVNAILEDHKGNIWVGTDGGGLSCMQQNGHCKSWHSNNSDIQGDRIWSLLEDRHQNIWIGTYGNGLLKFNPESGIFVSYQYEKSDPCSLPNPRVLALYEDRNGCLWAGTRGGGLAGIDQGSNKFIAYQHDPEDSLTISANTVTSILEDGKGRLWIGTFEGGLNLFDRESGIFVQFSDSNNNKVLGTNNDIWSLAEDWKGNLWAGTSSGLCKVSNINPETRTISTGLFTTHHGIPDNVILGIMVDKQGALWITTFNGMARLEFPEIKDGDKTSPVVSVFGTSDGLQSIEFNQGAYHVGKSGKIYAGGINGLNILPPDRINNNKITVPVAINTIKLFYKDLKIHHKLCDSLKMNDIEISGRCSPLETDHEYYLPVTPPFIKELILSYRQNVITISFVSLDFFNPVRNKFATRLEGFDENWNDPGNQNSVTYTNLNPGHYVFKVKATNSDGVWMDESAVLHLVIQPPFWKTVWFITGISAIIMIILVVIVWLIIRMQKKKALKKAERERELVELQLKAIKSQIDPHFTFNAINSIGSFIYNEPPDKTYDYFTKFSKLIRSTLHNTDRLYLTLNEELDFVKTYLDLEKIRFKDKFDYFITVDPAIDTSIHVPKMIIQTYVENAVKHGLMHRAPGGRLEVTAKLINRRIHFMITDNGIGRQKAEELAKYSTHRGLHIIKQFYDMHNKLYDQKITHQITDVYDEKGEAAGTCVEIQFPLMQESNIR